MKLKLSLQFKDNYRRCQLAPWGLSLFPSRTWRVSGKVSEQKRKTEVFWKMGGWEGQAHIWNLNFSVRRSEPGTRWKGDPPRGGLRTLAAITRWERGTSWQWSGGRAGPERAQVLPTQVRASSAPAFPVAPTADLGPSSTWTDRAQEDLAAGGQGKQGP